MPVMSSAGSLDCQERTSSTYRLPCPVKALNGSPLAGQVTMPSWYVPRPPVNCPVSLGPLTTAPTAEPCARLDTWCCMHFGYVLPSPTITLVPHAFAPSSQSRCCVAYPRKDVSWLRPRYSASVARNPNVCASTSKSV